MRNEKKVNKAAYLVLCLTALAVSCLIFACFSPWQNETGKGTFSITIGGGSGRAAVEFLLWEPETKIADLEHTITLTNNSGLSMPPREGVKAGQKIQFSVDPGHWVITVEAYLIIDESKVLKARGSKPVNLKPGYNGAITIDMDKPEDFNLPSGNVSVTDVMLNRYSFNLVVGGNSGTLIATVEPDNATNKNVRWVSSDPTVAIVVAGENGHCTVTPVNTGEAIITVTTQDGEKTASCNVTVYPAGSKILAGTVNIIGKTEVEQELRADTSGLNVSGPFTYQWKRGDELSAIDDNVIGENITYKTVSADVGSYIWLIVTCDGYDGEASVNIGPIVIPVTLNSVTVNAPSTVNTTALILTFDKAIIGLTSEDITLGGVSGVNKGDLIVSNNGSVYTLSIGGFTSGGALTVAVTSPSGYKIIGSPKTVNIYYITYTVTFNSNGGSSVPVQTVAQGENATRPADPARDGYTFINWCSDEKLEAEYDFDTQVTANTTLYAKWIITFTSLSNLATWLGTQPGNSTTTPYTVKFNITDRTILTTSSSIGSVIKTLNGASPTRYVYLDLSGGTITDIPSYAFYGGQSPYGCNALVGITIPGTVKTIGEHAFRSCSNLANITIPDSVTSIGARAFQDCTSLKSITIPESVTEMGNSTFENCTGLKSINIPNNVTTIGNYTFANCPNLDNIIIPNNVTTIGESSFSGCAGFTSITIPSGVTSVARYAFYCTNLTSITFQGAIPSGNFHASSFYGDLRAKFYATDSTDGTPGTYTTTAPVKSNSVWTKQP